MSTTHHSNNVRLVTYSATLGALDGAEADENGGGTTGICEDRRVGVFGRPVVKDLEVAVGSSPASVNNTLRDALMVKPCDLFPGDVVLQKCRADIGSIGDR